MEQKGFPASGGHTACLRRKVTQRWQHMDCLQSSSGAEEEAECVHTQSWEQVGISLAVFIFSAQ